MFFVNGRVVTISQFPDGQPHVMLDEGSLERTSLAKVECSITSPKDLMVLMMITEVLRAQHPPKKLESLTINYLMGARMDRRIDLRQPFTLRVVTDAINSLGYERIYLFDVHSEVSSALLNAENVLPILQIRNIEYLLKEEFKEIILIAPDVGATKRVEVVAGEVNRPVVHCVKHRDPQTGRLSGFQILEKDLVDGKSCLIVDDICDGGGTFVGIAKKLREAGAERVFLYVSHGIFSKGFELAGIDRIWTTDSYRDDFPTSIEILPIHTWYGA